MVCLSCVPARRSRAMRPQRNPPVYPGGRTIVLPAASVIGRDVEGGTPVTNLADASVRDAVEAAGPLDLLLTDGLLAVLRRVRPDSSLLRLGAGLARRPRLVSRQAVQ